MNHLPADATPDLRQNYWIYSVDDDRMNYGSTCLKVKVLPMIFPAVAWNRVAWNRFLRIPVGKIDTR